MASVDWSYGLRRDKQYLNKLERRRLVLTQKLEDIDATMLQLREQIKRKEQGIGYPWPAPPPKRK